MSSCATTDQLERFLLDKLDGLERDDVSTHIEECTVCQQALERLTEGNEPPTSPSSLSHTGDRDTILLERLKALGPMRAVNQPERGLADRDHFSETSQGEHQVDDTDGSEASPS